MIALLLALAAATPAPAPPIAHPALWKAYDADTTIYLFGTVHALPEGYQWRDPAIDRAMKAAGRLTVETLIGDPAAMGRLLLELGTPATPLPPLPDRVPADRRDALADLVRRSGLPPAVLDRLETWAAAFLLVQPVMADLGVSGASGVEEALKAEFAGRPVDGLETVREQLGFIDTLPEPDQRAFLLGFVEKADDMRAEFARMLAAWAAGDEAAIARTFDTELKTSKTLRAALLTRRNAAWAAALKARLDTEPGVSFVAVGAGHLAGPDSVQALLRAKGVTVERVQ